MDWLRRIRDRLLTAVFTTDTNWVDLTDGGTTTLHTHTSGTASAVTVANEITDTSCFILFATAATGDLGPKSNANLTFNSSTGVFTFGNDVNAGATLTTGNGVSTGAAGIEVGGLRTGSGISYIDWHSTAAGPDYEARILRNSATNGTLEIRNLGTGDMEIYANNALQVSIAGTASATNRVILTGSNGSDASVSTNGSRLSMPTNVIVTGSLQVSSAFSFNYNSAARPAVDNGFAGTWNYSAGSAEVDFWNTYVASVPAVSFSFKQMLSASTHEDLLAVSSTGIVANKNLRVSHGTSALATNATEGFFHIQSCAGAPTGVPASIPTGQIPMVYDSTNNFLYVYNGGWKKSTVYA
jgi:hypothetical protein